MPKRIGSVVYMEKLSLAERSAIPDGFQQHWYRHAAQFVRGKTVLDVGSGSGCGLPVLTAAGASVVRGIDPLPCGTPVYPRPFGGVAAGTVDLESTAGYDFVLAVDVLEHVDDDVGFFNHLMRVARVGVFFSTPNWNYSHATNEHHVQEFSPEELAAFLDAHAAGKRYETWTSDGRCVITKAALSDAKENFGVLVWK